MEKITTIPTPNPNAFKLILEKPVKESGKSTYSSQNDCPTNFLAKKLFLIDGIDKLHFFENSITITKLLEESWDVIEDQVHSCINTFIDQHDPSYIDPNPEAKRRAMLPLELKQIEEILDRTIRPFLQADGGDIQTVQLVSNCLIVKFEGACGSCPSATSGTLQAIQSALRDEYDPAIQVVPDMEG